MADLLDDLKQSIREAHGLLVEAVDGLTDEQLAHRPGGTTPSIAFHLWHSARWADSDQSAISGNPEVWLRDAYAPRWHLADTALGEAGTGTGMSDDQSAGLALPGKTGLLEYVTAAFAAFDAVAGRLTAAQLGDETTASDGTATVQARLLVQQTHTNRHLGMIEALKGLQGLHGTATR
ncbi:MAG TPA: DinB family protein [Dehalococcoidia bacterium]|nr:DinB family protein [Dehalococcoidia bacterium]